MCLFDIAFGHTMIHLYLLTYRDVVSVSTSEYRDAPTFCLGLVSRQKMTTSWFCVSLGRLTFQSQLSLGYLR